MRHDREDNKTKNKEKSKKNMNEKVNKQEFYVKNFDLSLNCFQRHNALTICLVFNDLINN